MLRSKNCVAYAGTATLPLTHCQRTRHVDTLLMILDSLVVIPTHHLDTLLTHSLVVIPTYHLDTLLTHSLVPYSPRDLEEDKRQEMLDRGYFRPAKKDEEEEEGVLRRTNVHLVSCHSGMGIDKLMGSLMGMAMDHGNKVTSLRLL